MNNDVVNYVNYCYNSIYSSKSYVITPSYFDSLQRKYVLLINSDKFILSIIKIFTIAKHENKHEHYTDIKEYKECKQALHDYIVDKTNNYTIYIDSNWNYYCSNYMYYNASSMFTNPKIDDALKLILKVPTIILQRVNVDHMYDSSIIIDLQFLPNCIQDIIYQYRHDVIYDFIKMVLDASIHTYESLKFKCKYTYIYEKMCIYSL